MDILSDILGVIQMRGSLYFRTEFTPPWGVRVPALGKVARFHLVSRGQCWVRVGEQGPPLLLSSGDLIVIPHGAEHSLSDAPDTRVFSVDDVVSRAGFTGEGALIHGGDDDGSPACLVCGHFAFDEEARHPLLEALPAYIHIRGTDTLNHVWLDEAMRFIGHEAGSDRPGSQAIVNKLSEILFIQAIRAHVAQAGHRATCLAGLTDPLIGRALRLVHRAPHQRWTIAALAREAGLSRTGFAERFSALMGITPLQYITDWRMQKARQLLVEADVGMLDIAESVGYQSEAAFGRVFKKYFAIGPGAYRRAKRRPARTPSCASAS